MKQEGSSEADPTALAEVDSKRKRSATLSSDGESLNNDNESAIIQKRQRIRGPSEPTPRLRQSTLVGHRNGKVRAEIPPDIEAAIRAMPEEIQHAITTLERIRGYVRDLVEFKAILDQQQVEIEQRLEKIETRETEQPRRPMSLSSRRSARTIARE